MILPYFHEIEAPAELELNLVLDRLHKVLKAEEAPEKEINLIFTGDALVRELNRDYRKKDKTTDVLSFPMEEEDMLGEVYVSIPQVQKQAPRFGNSFQLELERVCVHGVLHILGYDHIIPSERKVMRSLEEKYMEMNIY